MNSVIVDLRVEHSEKTFDDRKKGAKSRGNKIDLWLRNGNCCLACLLSDLDFDRPKASQNERHFNAASIPRLDSCVLVGMEFELPLHLL